MSDAARPRGLRRFVARLRAFVSGAPVVHFLVLGAALFAVHIWQAPSSDALPRAPVVVSAADIERCRQQWTEREGGAAAPLTDAALIDAATDDAVLLREALEREFDRRDHVVRARLIALGHYLGLAAGGDDAAVEQEARRLGLQRSDETLRRHLVEMMRLAAAKPGPDDLPTDAALRAYYEQHRADFAQAERTELTHVYLSAARRGDRLASDAAQLLAHVRDDAIAPQAAAALGDPFARGAEVLAATADELDRAFGPGFAAAISDLPERTWSGPLPSAYGLHLVWISRRLPAMTPAFAAVRSRVLHRYLDEHAAARLHDRLLAWRARYDIRVER